MKTHVICEKKGQVAYLIFSCDEPGKPATLDLQVLDELDDHLAMIHTEVNTSYPEGSLRTVVVQSDSPKYFVVGANINALETLDAESIVPWIEKGHAVFNALESLPLPVIARIEGYALGGGLELAMACDIILAAKSAQFGQPEASLGLIAGWGGTHRLPRRVGIGKAKELLFSGRIISAEEALRIGLIEFAGEPADVEHYLDALLRQIQQCSAVSIAQMKRLLNEGTPLAECCVCEAEASRVCISTEDTRSRIAGFLESRKKRRRE